MISEVIMCLPSINKYYDVLNVFTTYFEQILNEICLKIREKFFYLLTIFMCLSHE